MVMNTKIKTNYFISVYRGFVKHFVHLGNSFFSGLKKRFGKVFLKLCFPTNRNIVKIPQVSLQNTFSKQVYHSS